MISHLRGATIYKNERFLIVDVGGVGYKVFATNKTLDAAREVKEIAIWTYQSVREDSVSLYGFLTKEDLDIF